ncbi:MAG: amino acid permease [Methanoregula sp.]|nr:amino acid permease [Methanoregula sp.]
MESEIIHGTAFTFPFVIAPAGVVVMHSMFKTKTIEELIAATKGERSLKRVLKTYELILLGIGAIIGTGIFVLSGVAAGYSGPALPVSFIVAGLVCILAALCYAEFAAMVPVAGSAYTYCYASLGEIWAWIIGWDLILEYAVAVSAVAIGWSGYVANLLGNIGLGLPAYLINPPGVEGGLVNLPAFIIILLITGLLILGMKESARVTAVIVVIKVSILLLFIFLCLGHFQPVNWSNFMPNGWTGVVGGAAIIFFAFVGFDSVVIAAEETENPKKALPIALIVTLIACMILYVAVAAMLTGVVPFSDIVGQSAPISLALNEIGIPWGAALVSIGAICGMTTVLLVNLYGQSRIFFAMSRDRLLPPVLSEVHPVFKTPVKVTILVGVVTAFVAGFLPLRIVAELVNIGALFAFMVVALGVIILRYKSPEAERPFKCPLFPVIPILCILCTGFLIANLQPATHIQFVVWMVIGVIVYFVYVFRRNTQPVSSPILIMPKKFPDAS